MKFNFLLIIVCLAFILTSCLNKPRNEAYKMQTSKASQQKINQKNLSANRNTTATKNNILNNTSNTKADERGFFVKVGDKAPDFSFNLSTGGKGKLSNYYGRPVMLQFTASWCGVCIKEMPHIEKEIWQQYKKQGLIVLAIDRDEPIEKIRKLIAQTNITYPVALDPGANIFGKYADKKSGVTRNVIINKAGKIVYLTRLFDNEEFAAMKTKIKSIL